MESRNNKKHKKKRRKKKYSNNFFESKKWKELKKQVFLKYGYVCMRCGAKNCELHVDHIKSRQLYPNLEYEFNNLQVLCKDCNMQKGWKGKKDYRPFVNQELQNTTLDHWNSLGFD
jgi:uncharacterized protein (TIGR02646 family)